MIVDEDLNNLIENLPFFIRKELYNHPNLDKLIEIVMDLGRRPEARFTTGPEYLSQKLVSWQDLDYTIKRIGKFTNDNRAGIERTLHRISCIRNRQSIINGLTCRIGRAVYGTINLIRDLLESGHSILILGKPGLGKTTMIREIARILSEEIEKRVIIIDTSNEIAGDSDISHEGIGRARRMQVSKTELQHEFMIEAVENHMPEVIIIDEIGTELESLAARTIAERGVQLVGTAHGNSLENLIKNPPLSDLIGGIQYVTLSDDEAKRRGTQKSILERKAYPAFQIGIEINSRDSWTIHTNIENSVDFLLQGQNPTPQIRKINSDRKTNITYLVQNNTPFSFLKSDTSLNILKKYNKNSNRKTLTQSKLLQLDNDKNLVFYLYSLPDKFLKQAAFEFGFEPIITKDIKKSTIIIGLKKHLLTNINLLQSINLKTTRIYSVHLNNYENIKTLLKSVL